MTLEQWIKENAPGLDLDVMTHLNEWEVKEPAELCRMIMISIRQHFQKPKDF